MLKVFRNYLNSYNNAMHEQYNELRNERMINRKNKLSTYFVEKILFNISPNIYNRETINLNEAFHSYRHLRDLKYIDHVAFNENLLIFENRLFNGGDYARFSLFFNFDKLVLIRKINYNNDYLILGALFSDKNYIQYTIENNHEYIDQSKFTFIYNIDLLLRMFPENNRTINRKMNELLINLLQDRINSLKVDFFIDDYIFIKNDYKLKDFNDLQIIEKEIIKEALL